MASTDIDGTPILILRLEEVVVLSFALHLYNRYPSYGPPTIESKTLEEKILGFLKEVSHA